jgi:hypothetical protein
MIASAIASKHDFGFDPQFEPETALSKLQMLHMGVIINRIDCLPRPSVLNRSSKAQQAGRIVINFIGQQLAGWR